MNQLKNEWSWRATFYCNCKTNALFILIKSEKISQNGLEMQTMLLQDVSYLGCEEQKNLLKEGVTLGVVGYREDLLLKISLTICDTFSCT